MPSSAQCSAQKALRKRGPPVERSRFCHQVPVRRRHTSPSHILGLSLFCVDSRLFQFRSEASPLPIAGPMRRLPLDAPDSSLFFIRLVCLVNKSAKSATGPATLPDVLISSTWSAYSGGA